MYFPGRCRYRTYHFEEAKYPVSWVVVQGQDWKYAKFRPYQSPWYRVSTKGMVASKGSYGHGELKNVLSQSMQIPYLLLRGRKVPRFVGGNIEPRMEICETSALPIPMVARLHQSNGYIIRKLMGMESKNVLPQSVQIPYLPLRGRKVPRFRGGSVRSRMEICETSALPIPMVSRLHQSNGYIKRKLQACRAKKCIALVGKIPYLPLRGSNVARFMGGCIGPRMEICETSALTIPMVPRFH